MEGVNVPLVVVETLMAAKDKKVAYLEKKLADLEGCHAELERHHAELETQNVALHSQRAELESHNAELEHCNTDLRARLRDAQESRAQDPARIVKVEAAISAGLAAFREGAAPEQQGGGAQGGVPRGPHAPPAVALVEEESAEAQEGASAEGGVAQVASAPPAAAQAPSECGKRKRADANDTSTREDRHLAGVEADPSPQAEEAAARGQVSLAVQKEMGTSSKYRGVSWRRKDNGWHVQIRRQKTQYDLGLFEDEEAAARAYDVALIASDGERAATNFPRESYGPGVTGFRSLEEAVACVKAAKKLRVQKKRAAKWESYGPGVTSSGSLEEAVACLFGRQP